MQFTTIICKTNNCQCKGRWITFLNGSCAAPSSSPCFPWAGGVVSGEAAHSRRSISRAEEHRRQREKRIDRPTGWGKAGVHMGLLQERYVLIFFPSSICSTSVPSRHLLSHTCPFFLFNSHVSYKMFTLYCCYLLLCAVCPGCLLPVVVAKQGHIYQVQCVYVLVVDS